MSMPVNKLKDQVGQELFVSDWIVVRLEQELAFQAATLLTKEDLGFDPASEDPGLGKNGVRGKYTQSRHRQPGIRGAG
jgi:hypothetical protein